MSKYTPLKRCKCPTCNGTGTTSESIAPQSIYAPHRRKKCSQCNGSGTVSR